MARPGRPERNRAARSFGQLRRFHHGINSDTVFGTHTIQIFESGQEFELLFSDVVMPNGMSGVELAREARRLNKGIKVLLTSGYAGDVLERHRAVDEFPIIDKPFRLADLARRLRSILHEAQDPHVPSLRRRSRTN